MNGLGKSYDVGVIADQFNFSFLLADNLDYIDSTYFCGVRIKLVQEGDHQLFVRDSDIETSQIGVLLDNFHKIIDLRNLEVHIFCVDTFGFELLVKVSDGE